MPDINPNSRELIDRSLVARALDRNQDGVISGQEFKTAGVERLDAEAVAAVNAPGEKGDAITVNELATALRTDRVKLSGEVTLQGGFAAFARGALERSEPWRFPVVPGLKVLEDVRRIAPANWGYYNPDSPSSEFTYTAHYKDPLTGQRVVYKEGMNLKDYMFPSAPDANGQRWVMIEGVKYDELASVLRTKAEAMRDVTRNATDPEIRQIHEDLNRILWSAHWNTGSRRDRARDLFLVLSRFDRIQVPEKPELSVQRLDGAFRTAVSQLAEQRRIVDALPVERAREAVGRAADRLHSPAHPLKLALTGVFGLGAGALALFAGGAALPVALGIGAAGLAGGYGLGWLINWGRARGYDSSLAVLKRIEPEANRRALEQHAVLGYQLLQNTREATTLAGVRAFHESAEDASRTITRLTATVAEETKALQKIEGLVRKHGG